MRLDEAIESFVAERRRLSYREMGTYERQLGLLLEMVRKRLTARRTQTGSGLTDERGDPLTIDLERADLEGVLDALVSRGLSPITVGHSVSVYRVFCRWLVKKGALFLSPAEDLPYPKVIRRIGYVPSQKEVARLLAAAHARARAGGGAEALRDLAILELLYGSGLRLSEALNLSISDVDLGERTAFLRRAKGDKDRLVPLTITACEALSRYLAGARSVLLGDECRAPDVLFLSASGTRLYSDWRRKSYRPLLAAAGLSFALTPHRLRHACAVHLLDAGADIAKIARLLGHERLDTTALYLALSTKQVAAALDASHPRERGA